MTITIKILWIQQFWKMHFQNLVGKITFYFKKMFPRTWSWIVIMKEFAWYKTWGWWDTWFLLKVMSKGLFILKVLFKIIKYLKNCYREMFCMTCVLKSTCGKVYFSEAAGLSFIPSMKCFHSMRMGN